MREQSLPIPRDESFPGAPAARPPAAANAPAPLPPQEPLLLTSFDHKRANSTGIVVTVLLHVLVIVLAWWHSSTRLVLKPPGSSIDVTYIPAPKVLPKPPPPTATDKPRVRPPRPQVANVKRLPNTITLPEERQVEPEVVETPKPPEPAKEAPPVDMADMIAARRAARARASGVEPQESEAERGERLALANIASANNKSRGSGREGGEALFGPIIHSPFTATLKFTGFARGEARNPTRDVPVELGTEPDIETALVKRMVQLIRAEVKTDFIYHSRRLHRDVPLSARVADNEALERFLFREMYPEHPRAR